MAPVPKTTQSAAPLLKNASAAPFVFFDNVPLYGTFGGNVEVELAARVLMPKPGNQVAVELVCAAHLRCSPASAMMLIDALQKSLALFDRQQADIKAAREDASGLNGTHLNS